MKKNKKRKGGKKSKSGFGLSLPKGNRGQMGMGLLTGMITAVLVFIMLSAFLPVIVSSIGGGKGSDAANCVGYVDPNAAALGNNNHSYNPNLSTDTITCSILNFTVGMFVLSVVFSIIAGVISGKLSLGSAEPQQQYYQQPYG